MKVGKVQLVGAAIILAGGFAVASSPASATVCCEGSNPFKGDGVRIHSCASTGCTTVGLGYRSQNEATVCLPLPEDQNGMLHIKDLATGVTGWVVNQYVTVLYCD